jgi:hypothetical protein
MLTRQEIESGLNQFSGSEQFYRTMSKSLIYTDGIHWLAENAGCFWLIDAIASHQPDALKHPRLAEIQFWVLTVKEDHAASLVCYEDIPGKERIRQEIPFTDFPLPTIKLYVENGTLFLPSER